MSPGEPHLAIVTLDFAPQIGGVQNYLCEIAMRVAVEYRVTVVTPVKGDGPEQRNLNRLTPVMSGSMGFWLALRKLRPTHVVIGHAHPRLLLAAAAFRPGGFAAFAQGNDFLAAQTRWHRPIFNYLLGRARPLLTNSGAMARRLHGLGLSGAIPVRPGVDSARFYPAGQGASGPPLLLSVCRLVPRKGIDTVIACMPSRLDEHANLQYLVVGDGPDRPRLERLAEEKGVQQSVRFAGQASFDELPAYYRMAHIFVLPTREELQQASIEGFGIAFLEGSASGLPIVAGRSGGVEEAVIDGTTGILTPPDDPQALSEALLRLLREPDLRRKLGKGGRAWVEEEMSWDRAAGELIAALALDNG